MSNGDISLTLQALHGQLAKTLLDKIKDGTATAADLSVARQFLKDNGIDALPNENTPLRNLADQLPFDPSQEEGH